MQIPKFPRDPDNFKYFQRDPPEVKLEAWRCLQRRLEIRDRAVCLAFLFSLVVTTGILVIRA